MKNKFMSLEGEGKIEILRKIAELLNTRPENVSHVLKKMKEDIT